jgi:hypothetical protein
MGTYLFQTAEKFTTVRDQLVQEGRPEDWIQYVYDSHHPTQKAAVEIIVPEMLSVMEGLGSAPLEPSVALSVQSMAGRSFYVGDTVQIQWYYDPARIPSVSLQLSVDGGQSYPAALVSSLSASAFLWPIPATAGAVSTVGENAVVKVESSDGSHADITGTFTILPATDKDPLTLEPLAHDLYHVGETLELAWSKDVNRVAGVEASLSLDGGANWHALNSSAIEATTFSWPIPATLDGAAILSSQALVKIQDYDKKYESYSELFVIHGPPHIIDDADPVVEVVGTWSRDAKYKNGYNGSYLDDDREARGEKTVTYPYTAPGEGTYALYAWTPYAGTGVPDYAPATVVASDGSHAVSIRIKKRTEWQHLGDFPLNEGFRSTVTIVNDVGGGTVVADAIKWEMVSGDVSTRTARRAGKAAPWRGPAFSAACRKDFLHLRHSRGIDRVHITTSDGRAVARYAGDGDRTMRIPVTHLPAGVYVVSTGRGPAGARALVTITR